MFFFFFFFLFCTSKENNKNELVTDIDIAKEINMETEKIAKVFVSFREVEREEKSFFMCSNEMKI